MHSVLIQYHSYVVKGGKCLFIYLHIYLLILRLILMCFELEVFLQF